jgi:hypothetical protein
MTTIIAINMTKDVNMIMVKNKKMGNIIIVKETKM